MCWLLEMDVLLCMALLPDLSAAGASLSLSMLDSGPVLVATCWVTNSHGD
jgi:hypothetical protein